MEEKRYSKIEIVNALNQLKLSHLEKNLFGMLDSAQKDNERDFGGDNAKIRYLKGKSGKKFNRTENSPENSFFKMYNESNGIASFEFCGNGEEAIAKRIFSDDICDIVSGSYRDYPNSVKTIKPGKIKYLGDDQWEAIEQTQISLFQIK